MSSMQRGEGQKFYSLPQNLGKRLSRLYISGLLLQDCCLEISGCGGALKKLVQIIFVLIFQPQSQLGFQELSVPVPESGVPRKCLASPKFFNDSIYSMGSQSSSSLSKCFLLSRKTVFEKHALSHTGSSAHGGQIRHEVVWLKVAFV